MLILTLDPFDFTIFLDGAVSKFMVSVLEFDFINVVIFFVGQQTLVQVRCNRKIMSQGEVSSCLLPLARQSPDHTSR